jgi:hypothetical protein
MYEYKGLEYVASITDSLQDQLLSKSNLQDVFYKLHETKINDYCKKHNCTFIDLINGDDFYEFFKQEFGPIEDECDVLACVLQEANTHPQRYFNPLPINAEVEILEVHIKSKDTLCKFIVNHLKELDISLDELYVGITEQLIKE